LLYDDKKYGYLSGMALEVSANFSWDRTAESVLSALRYN